MLSEKNEMSSKSGGEEDRSDNLSLNGSRSTSPTVTNLTNKNMMVSFDRCPQCTSQFDFLKRSKAWLSKVPLIINCQHTFCEDCINKLVKNDSLTCPTCKEISQVSRGQLGVLTDIFTPHYSLIGYLMWLRNTSPGKNVITLQPSGHTFRSKVVMGVDLNHDNPRSISPLEAMDGYTEALLPNFKFDDCEIHANSSKTLQCRECEVEGCCYCFLEKHAGHTAIYLHKLGDEEMLELKNLIDKAKIVVTFAKDSLQKVKELSTFNHATVEQTIKSYFTNLHGYLFNIEKKLLKSLTNYKVENRDLDEIKMHLKKNVLKTSYLLDMIRDFNEGQEMNIRMLREELENSINVPCRLFSDGNSLEPISFVTSDVMDNIEQYFSLQQSTDIQYDLETIDNLEELLSCSSDEVLQRVAKKIEHKAPHKKEKTNITTKEFCKPKMVEPKIIKVAVTHVDDLDNIYIRRGSDDIQLKAIMKYLKAYQPHTEVQDNEIVLGKLYAVMHMVKNTKSWRRGKIRTIDQKGQDGDKFYKVFFIDFGSNAHVTIDMIRQLDATLAKRQPCVVACKLTNPDHIMYGPSSHVELCRLIQDKETYVSYVDKQKDQPPEIDIFIPNSGGEIVSVRELLSQNSASVSINESEHLSVKTQQKFFKNSKTFKMGQKEHVLVTHIKDPYNIYVQLEQNIPILNKMLNNMEQFYSQTLYSCVPVQDTDVIVRHKVPKQGDWHRGTVLNVDTENKRAEIFFVDWGGCALVSWKNTRILKQEFTKVECQAIKVQLAHVKPPTDIWSLAATEFIKQDINKNGNVFNMIVGNISPLEVGLFQERPMADICLNAQLVEKQFALCTGTLSGTVFWPHGQNVADGNNDEYDMTHQEIKKAEEILILEEDPELKTGVKMNVNVLRCDSPDCIVIKFDTNKPTEERMMKDLKIHYGSGDGVKKKSCAENELCVYYDPLTKIYHRCVVRGKLANNQYNVYLIDQGHEFKVDLENMFVLEDHFKKSPAFIFKCRLANLKPVGGEKGNWSQIAKETLSRIFTMYPNISVKKAKAGSQIPFDAYIWYVLTTPGSALEPMRRNYISINRMLIECGVAMGVPESVESTTETVDVKSQIDNQILQLPNDFVSDFVSSSHIENEVGPPEKAQTIDEVTVKEKEKEVEPVILNQWLDSLVLLADNFEAVLVCLTNEGILVIRDKSINGVYKELEDSIRKYMEGEKCNKKEKWKANDMCMVKENGIWYRASVIEVVNKNHIRIEMIDFNSEHDVKPQQLSRRLVHTDIPKLVNKIQLYDVCPKFGQWTMDDYETVLENVSNEIHVEIIGSRDQDIPAAEITLKDGTNLNDRAAQLCPNLIRCRKVLPALELTRDEDVDSHASSNFEFKYPPLYADPKHKSGFTVVSILGYKEVVLNVLNKDGSDLSSDMMELYNEIQQDGNSQPKLEQIDNNMPCICYNLVKNMWCRAYVYNTDSLENGYLLAFYVDYGIIGMVTLDAVRKIRKKWLKRPVFNVRAGINVELIDESQETYVKMQLESFCGKEVAVKIIEESPLIVHLYEGNKLCYKNFVDLGILKLL